MTRDAQRSSEPSEEPHPELYVYQDRGLGPAEPLSFEISPDVFKPTSTTRLLLRAARRDAGADLRSALDLGCGCGVVAVALRRFVVPRGEVCASDVSPAAVELTRRNATRLGVEVDARCGSLFEPWKDRRFDLVVDDVAAMAEPLARASPWYPPQVPSEAGEDGTRWITAVIQHAPRQLARGGRLLFPLLTLAGQERPLAAARAAFRTVRLLEEEWYPFGQELASRLDLVLELADRGIVEIRRRGSRWTWGTRVYLAADPVGG